MRGFRMFTIADVPVMISPWFALLGLFIVNGSGVARGATWIGALTLSLLVHEFGHALVARHFRLGPSVLLHGLGGLCSHSEAESDRDDALIVAAGPAAGLAFGLVLLPIYFFLPDVAPGATQTLVWTDIVLRDLLLLNIGWSLVNLLPVWPLDGGHLFRLGLTQITSHLRAERITHGTGIALLVVGGIVLYRFFGGGLLVFLILFGLWQNWRGLRGEIRSGAFRPKSQFAGQLLQRATEAYSQSNWREAARLGHLVRGEKNIPAKVLRQTWAVLGPATARLGEFEEALRYLERAPSTQDVVEAQIECLHNLGDDRALDQLLASEDFRRHVPEARRDEILAVVREGNEEKSAPAANS